MIKSLELSTQREDKANGRRPWAELLRFLRWFEGIDVYTAGHQGRVAGLACSIADEMCLEKRQNKGIYIAGLLHDIGKIAVPADILVKPGVLSRYEFSMIRDHPQVGYEILKGIEFPWPISQAVLQHHERLDGSGYPQGLYGGDIILEARILGVADVVDAIAAPRPYRPALGLEIALEEISRGSGILYDPEVVDACLELFQKGELGFERLAPIEAGLGYVMSAS